MMSLLVRGSLLDTEAAMRGAMPILTVLHVMDSYAYRKLLPWSFPGYCYSLSLSALVAANCTFLDLVTKALPTYGLQLPY